MADVTRYDLVATMGGWTIGPDTTGRFVSLAAYAKAEADHLAALERVRVETLRELDKQLATAMELLDGDPAVIGLRKARFAIDHLINAATTGATDD